MLAYASQNMTHDLLLQESHKLEGLSLQQPERRDTHGEEDSMVLHIKIFVLLSKLLPNLRELDLLPRPLREDSPCCALHLRFVSLSTYTKQPCHRRYWTK